VREGLVVAADEVVVGYDGSVESTCAVDWAVEYALSFGKRLTVVHAVDPAATTAAPGLAPMPYTAEYWREAERLLEVGYARAAHRLTKDRVDKQLSAEGAAAALVAASRDASLVVTGSRGLSRVAAGLLGSASYTVAAHADCPSVIVRTGRTRMPDADHPVVVGVDGSPAAAAALERAADIAARTGAKLHVVSVGHLRSPEAAALAEATRGGTERTRAVRALLEKVLADAEATLRRRHEELKVETEVLFGRAGTVLAQLGDGAGLLVVGSRGRGGFSGMLLGSVSHAVVHESRCPVLITRG
jgi:nucleotide-binding universal stress UspA family protein